MHQLQYIPEQQDVYIGVVGHAQSRHLLAMLRVQHTERYEVNTHAIVVAVLDTGPDKIRTYPTLLCTSKAVFIPCDQLELGKEEAIVFVGRVAAEQFGTGCVGTVAVVTVVVFEVEREELVEEFYVDDLEVLCNQFGVYQ